MKKYLLAGLIGMMFLLGGCISTSNQQESNAQNKGIDVAKSASEAGSVAPKAVSNNEQVFRELDSQLDIAIKSGGISPESYDWMQGQISNLESQGYDIKKIVQLRQKLSLLSVGGQQNTLAVQNQENFQNDNRISYDILTEKEKELLPECASTLFTQSPVNIGDITGIEPIGSTNPPEHALASSSTDVYISVNTRLTDRTVPLYAPADLWLIKIHPRYNITSDPEDHVIEYALCKDVYGIVDHVKSFSDEMKEIVENYECKYGGKPGDDKCPILLVKKIKAGTLLGTVGRLQGNFNFGTWDLRHNNSFKNPDRYGIRSLHSVCPLNYYPEPLKRQLTNLIDREDKNCGSVEYEIFGTAQGEWFYGDSGNYMHGDWVNHLFLGYSNRFPEAAVISVGGVISDPLKWMFIPEISGTKNVGFQHIKDNKIFCYENDRNGKYRNYEKGPTGRILIRLEDSYTIKIEYQQGTCSGDYSFVNPVRYKK